MKITMNRVELIDLMGKLKAAVPKKISLDVAKTVLLRTEKGRLVATANSLEYALTGSCKAKVAAGGSICVVPDLLTAFLKAVSTETVTLSTTNKLEKWTVKESYREKGNGEYGEVKYRDVEKSRRSLAVRLEAGSAVTTITDENKQVYESKDFPPVPKVRGKSLTATLAPALNEVDYAVATEDARPTLCGISFRQVENKLELAAADGFRLAVTAIKPKGKLTKEMIVDAKAMNLVKHLMPKAVTITQMMKKGKNHEGKTFTTVEAVSFDGAGMVLVVKPTMGTYPNYQQLIPKTARAVKADRSAMLEALKVMDALKPESGIVRLETKGKNLLVWAKGDAGRTEVKVPARGNTRIAFNLRYLKDMVQKAGTQVVLRTESPSAPGLVKTNGTSHVLMPMFVQENWITPWSKADLAVKAAAAAKAKAEAETIEAEHEAKMKAANAEATARFERVKAAAVGEVKATASAVATVSQPTDAEIRQAAVQEAE